MTFFFAFISDKRKICGKDRDHRKKRRYLYEWGKEKRAVGFCVHPGAGTGFAALNLQLIRKEKRELVGKPVFVLAAAGLLFLIGFSVLFLWALFTGRV